ncbi:hypothetical protein K9M74_03670 [Candidatus Woesearchaeota archaeon]|nr:hypothetical protein [Candidatus Woesearchaeota archaeon]MCF8012765.1 hypothetical protein [Candidatus Woesearchaeota archaeon]
MNEEVDTKMQAILQKPLSLAQQRKQLKTVIFLRAVPKFVDLSLRSVGPFEKGDVLRAEIDVANVLILKGRAKEFDID